MYAQAADDSAADTSARCVIQQGGGGAGRGTVHVRSSAARCSQSKLFSVEAHCRDPSNIVQDPVLWLTSATGVPRMTVKACHAQNASCAGAVADDFVKLQSCRWNGTAGVRNGVHAKFNSVFLKRGR